MRTMFTAAANHIASLVATATGQFTGIAWDSGPQQLLATIRQGAAINRDPAELASDLAGAYWPADNSPASQSLRARWDHLIDAAARGTATEVDAQALVDAEAAVVKAAADSAAEQGRLTVEAVRVGDWGALVVTPTQYAAVIDGLTTRIPEATAQLDVFEAARAARRKVDSDVVLTPAEILLTLPPVIDKATFAVVRDQVRGLGWQAQPRCAVCRLPQMETSGGVNCPNGHGDAPHEEN